MADSLPFEWIDSHAVKRQLTYPRLFVAIEGAFAENPVAAPRVSLPYQGRSEKLSGTLLLMSAILPETLAGVKIITYNLSRDSGVIKYIYVAIEPVSGALLAIIDGESMSTRRTAAVSVVASQYLAIDRPQRILIIGTGPVARELVTAYGTAYPSATLLLWGRRPAAVEAILDTFANGPIRVSAARNLDDAVSDVDIVSSATGSSTPIIKGKLLRAGAHVDLIGGFTPTMREADDAVLQRAGRVFTDNVSALQEAGDLCEPIASGVLLDSNIGFLENILAKPKPSRSNPELLTVFKSVGNSVFDLAAAGVVIEQALGPTRTASSAEDNISGS